MDIIIMKNYSIALLLGAFLSLIYLSACQTGVPLPQPYYPIDIQLPWITKRCCNVHNIYALDVSGSMAWGGSWSKALSFLSSSWPTSEYVSFITHGGTWAGPPFSVSTIYTHALYPSFPGSFPGLPNGDTDYDDPLMAIMNILANGFPDRTCVHLVGDGWQQLYNSPWPGIVSAFLTSKKRFQKTTGCPLCIKCYQTQKGGWYFEQLCKQLGATMTTLNSILIKDVLAYTKQMASGQKIDFTYDGEPPKPTGDQTN